MLHPVGLPIINVHSHYHAYETMDEVRGRAESFGIKWYVMSCLRPVDGVSGNDVMRKVMKEHGDFAAALYHLDPDEEKPEVVAEAKEDGFKGIKIIGTLKPYDSVDYYPFYAAIEKAGLPILFHTGFLSILPGQRGRTVSMMNMRPGMLDTLGRAFPEMKMVGAHLGAPWYWEALNVACFHKNVYFDLSGGIVRAQSLEFYRRLFSARDVGQDGIKDSLLPPEKDVPNLRLVGKMMFGTDNPPPNTLVPFTQRWLDGLSADDETRRRVWYQNAAEVFGLEV